MVPYVDVLDSPASFHFSQAAGDKIPELLLIQPRRLELHKQAAISGNKFAKSRGITFG
jgi:hypothetical protein